MELLSRSLRSICIFLQVCHQESLVWYDFLTLWRICIHWHYQGCESGSLSCLLTWCWLLKQGRYHRFAWNWQFMDVQCLFVSCWLQKPMISIPITYQFQYLMDIVNWFYNMQSFHQDGWWKRYKMEIVANYSTYLMINYFEFLKYIILDLFINMMLIFCLSRLFLFYASDFLFFFYYLLLTIIIFSYPFLFRMLSIYISIFIIVFFLF